MKKLRAKTGKQHTFQLDPETAQKLNHCRLFIARNFEIEASEGVVIRRAVALLTEHYDQLQEDLNQRKEFPEELERYWLNRVSEPSFLTKVDPIPEGQPMMTYEARIEKEQSKVTAETILKEASIAADYKMGLHLTGSAIKHSQGKQKRRKK